MLGQCAQHWAVFRRHIFHLSGVSLNIHTSLLNPSDGVVITVLHVVILNSECRMCWK